MTQKDKALLEEAARRMKHFEHDINHNMLGLGYPSEYKSKYFTPSFREIPRALNWYKLTEEGKKYLAK